MRRLGTLSDVVRLLAAEADRTTRQRLAYALMLVSCGGLLSAMSPLALKAMVDALEGMHGASQAPYAALTSGALYVLALCAGRLVAELRPRVAGAAEHRLYTRLRQRYYGHLLDLPLAFHLSRPSGALLHSVHQASTGCQIVVTHVINSIVPVLVEVCAVTIALAHVGQPALVATFAIATTAYVAIFWAGAAGLSARAHAVSEASQVAHALLADSLLNCETIKCFGAEAAMRRRYAHFTEALEACWSSLHGQRARIGLAVTATFAASMAASVVLSFHAVAQGTLSVGGFVLATVYMLQIVRPLEMLGAAARDVTQALAFLGPFIDVLKQPVETPALPPAQGRRAVTGMPDAATEAASVRFEGVHFAYEDGREALAGLDLAVERGRTLAIVGASGSGKSSVVRLLLRLYEPQAGRILLDGVPIGTIAAGRLRAAIGVVPQDVALFNDTIAANIAIARPDASRADVEAAARLARLQDFVARLPAGYDTPVGDRGLMLSGGERQRIAIARVLLRRPRVFVFDEATSMLDGTTEAAILADLRELSSHCTTITIAHRLTAVRHADEIVVLENGRVAERGRHAQLLSSGGIYASLWRRQMNDTQTRRQEA